MLEVREVVAGYGRLEVLHRVSVQVETGEIVAVIGANGAGKTTLLRVVSGLLRASNGTVLLDGVDVTRLPAERLAAAGLAHVPENRLVFPTLSVEDNLTLGGWTRRRGPRGETESQRQRALDLFPRLQTRRRQPAGTLSGGEQQMLAIARGLMARPKLLVLDEPSVGLAPKVIAEIFATLARLRDDGLTILLVEQNARAAFKVADRVYVMDRGEVAMDGNPTELLTDQRVHQAYLGGGYTA
ncbi:MAG TPA: ABC transporter ATP-binding protein [Kribbella sp.]|uniref:ABC transporter ATP-binding protein n=1 Tax=Kribbella sp. TaxID=1871183 RepID=UPI002D7845D6|nr:ABC transporter ATP-binding protein [Kribbella sp.]HET6294433.1 ABC transporter ATP-binding protein [Kribbella sp.]